jgi:hypothetical protein
LVKTKQNAYPVSHIEIRKIIIIIEANRSIKFIEKVFNKQANKRQIEYIDKVKINDSGHVKQGIGSDVVVKL